MSEQIVFSYQGAFGPPTYGHYKSMETFIKQITKDYDKSQHYTFLFMPTKSSSSKPHLKGTMYHRQLILQKFCEKLKETYKATNIIIAPSRIEFDDTTSSDTINTIDELIKEYSGAKIILGMGQDNALQLPYWKSIEEYAGKVERIYLVTRDVTGGEIREFTNQNGTPIGKFDAKVPSWAAYIKRLELVFEKGSIKIPKENEGKEGTVLPPDIKIVKPLPEIKKITATIPPSSSSMIRHFISRIIKNEERIKENEERPIKFEERIKKNKAKIKKLMFGNAFAGDDKIDKLVDEVIGDYKTLYKVIESLESSYDKNIHQYNGEYAKYEEYVSQNGGKSKRKKLMKKKRKTLKKKSKSNRRKSLKKKQRKTKRKGRR